MYTLHCLQKHLSIKVVLFLDVPLKQLQYPVYCEEACTKLQVHGSNM